jgi:hypothetical protein
LGEFSKNWSVMHLLVKSRRVSQAKNRTGWG